MRISREKYKDPAPGGRDYLLILVNSCSWVAFLLLLVGSIFGSIIALFCVSVSVYRLSAGFGKYRFSVWLCVVSLLISVWLLCMDYANTPK